MSLWQRNQAANGTERSGRARRVGGGGRGVLIAGGGGPEQRPAQHHTSDERRRVRRRRAWRDRERMGQVAEVVCGAQREAARHAALGDAPEDGQPPDVLMHIAARCRVCTKTIEKEISASLNAPLYTVNCKPRALNSVPYTLQPYIPTTLQPYNPTTLQPYIPTSLHPYNPTSLQPYNPTTLQPYNPTTLQPYTLYPIPYTLYPKP